MTISRPSGSVFVLTDFGTSDEFAGVIRAVVAREAPGAPIVDLTHDIAPFDVRAGALALERAVPHLGPGVLLAVVDPGVGTSRRPVAISVVSETGPTFLVGPDNGLFTFALDALGGADGAAMLAPVFRHPDAGATFDGRDIFAPAAASLWVGATLAELGSPLDPVELVRLEPPRLEVSPGSMITEVLWVDRFGNVQLAAKPNHARAAGLGEAVEVRVSTGATFIARSTSSFSVGRDIGLMADSNGHLSLVRREGSAADALGIGPRDILTLRGAPAATHRVASDAPWANRELRL